MARTRSAPTTGQGIFGVAVLLAFAVLALWWAIAETGGARIFPLFFCAMFLALAAVRGVATFRAAKKSSTAGS